MWTFTDSSTIKRDKRRHDNEYYKINIQNISAESEPNRIA